MEPIRILIADDHLFYREGVRTLLKGVPDVAIVGDATSGDEAVAQAATLQPDIVLMDIKMPGLNGIEATRHIRQNCPQIGVLVVTMFDDDETVFAAMRAGARGYLLKDADREELLRAVNAVHRGEASSAPRSLSGWCSTLRISQGGQARPPAAALVRLDQRAPSPN